MKHKHYDKIVAKSANMNLVVFCRDAYHVEEGWFETPNLPIQDEFDYYLCLPQHKKACLAWLNGANINFTSDVWSGVFAEETPWTVYNNTLPMSELTDEQAVELFVAWRKGGGVLETLEGVTIETHPTWEHNSVYAIKCKSDSDQFVEKMLTFYKHDAIDEKVIDMLKEAYDNGCRFV